MDKWTSLSNHILPKIYCRGKEFLLHCTSLDEINVKTHSTICDIINILEDSQEFSYQDVNRIIILLATIYEECSKPAPSKYEEELFNFCCYCVNELVSFETLGEYTNAKELSFSIAGFHNRNSKSVDIYPKYIKLIEKHTILMFEAVFYYMEIRYTSHTSLVHPDSELLNIIFDNIYHDLLLWFGNESSWSKFHIYFYTLCLKIDTEKKYFHNADNYLVHILRALDRKENGNNTMKLLSIVLCNLNYNEFMRIYFYKFIYKYKAWSIDEVSTSYNYNLMNYVLPVIIDTYPTEVVHILESLSNGVPFFEDVFLVVLTIASRKKIINFDWCLNDHIYYNLQVCQSWIAENTLNVIINEIADSNNIVICFKFLPRFMCGASYQRLCSINLLKILHKFMVYLKSYIFKISRRKICDESVTAVSNFTTFLLQFSKARFKDAEESHKQYYFGIFQMIQQNLPNFFHEDRTEICQEEKLYCATTSVIHFVNTLKQNEALSLSSEDVEGYLQILLQHKQLHCIEHCLIIEIIKYSHCVKPVSSYILAVTLAVYRKLITADMISDKYVKADIIERIILNIIPKQNDTDPNIFVDMDAGFEQAVIEGVKIISHMIKNNQNYDPRYKLLDYLRLCEHILEYGPSKKLVFEISRLHRVTLKEQAEKKSLQFYSYMKQSFFLISDGSINFARRAMRRHPAITETMRNILVATIECYESERKLHHTRLQNELLNFAKAMKDTNDIYFVIVTETQKVFFDMKEFPFSNIIRVEELIMHILHSLDIVLRWDAITALVQLLQAIMTTLLERAGTQPFRKYFNLVNDIMSLVPSRTITSIAALYVLHALHFTNIPLALKNKLTAVPTQNNTMLCKVLYECTISSRNIPLDSVTSLTNDVNDENRLEKYSDQTCEAIVALLEIL